MDDPEDVTGVCGRKPGLSRKTQRTPEHVCAMADPTATSWGTGAVGRQCLLGEHQATQHLGKETTCYLMQHHPGQKKDERMTVFFLWNSLCWGATLWETEGPGTLPWVLLLIMGFVSLGRRGGCTWEGRNILPVRVRLSSGALPLLI